MIEFVQKSLVNKKCKISKSNSKRHSARSSSTYRPKVCTLTTKKQIDWNTNRTVILIAEKKFECHNCSKLFRSKGVLQHHIMKWHSTMEDQYQCEHCIGTFTSRGAIMRHMASHMLFKQFPCKICKKAFKWKSALSRHIMLIHGVGARLIQCDACSMSFKSNDALKAHYRVHSGERPYKCELCSQPYSYKRDFNRHCLKKHGVIVDRRPVYVMNDEVLKSEKALMKDLMLRLHGIPTESEPMDSFRGPQKALAFAKAVKIMQNGQIPIDVQC